MPSQLVLSVRERATPGLNRGWRTPDPSPTRTSNGLPHCGASSWEVTDIPEISDEDDCDSSPDWSERAAEAPAPAARGKPGLCARGPALEPCADGQELMEATTPRGHGQEAWGPPRRGALLGSFCGGCGASAADALRPAARAWASSGATPDAAFSRIRTPSPEARALPPPAGPQRLPQRPPQWLSGPAARPPRARGRTPPPEACALAPPLAAPAWPPQEPPQGMAPRREPSAGAPPPPRTPGSASARPRRARAGEPQAAAAMAQKKKSPDRLGMPKDFAGVLSVGSVGHPYTCQDACKYVRKNRGCKDGADCSHCHVCVWNRYEASRATRRA